MKQPYLLFVIIILINSHSFAESLLKIDPLQTVPVFEIKHFGLTILRGHFKATSGTVSLDPRSETGRINIAINTESISTGVTLVDQLLIDENFLDASRYPTIHFTSNKLHFTDQQLIAVDGLLSLHGITRPINLTIENFQCSPDESINKTICKANAFTTINRSEFGINNYRPLVTNNVKIIINVQAIQD